MIPYARPRVSDDAIRVVNDLLKAGQFAPAEYARKVENMYIAYDYHGVFVNSGSTANYLLVGLLFEHCKVVDVPPIAFATTYGGLVADNKIISFGQIKHGDYRVQRYRDDAEAVFDCPVLGLPNVAPIPDNAVFGADLCDCDAQGLLYYKRKPDAFTMSFHPAHIINGGGGGAVYFRDAALAERARKIVYWGRSCTQDVCTCSCEGCTGEKRYEYDLVGCNLQGSEINAAIAIDAMSFDCMSDMFLARNSNHEALFNACLDNKLLKTYHPEQFEDKAPFAFPIRTDYKPQLKAALRKAGIEHRDLFTDGREYAFKFKAATLHPFDNPINERDKWLFIGCHENLTADEIRTMCSVLKAFDCEEAYDE